MAQRPNHTKIGGNSNSRDKLDMVDTWFSSCFGILYQYSMSSDAQAYQPVDSQACELGPCKQIVSWHLTMLRSTVHMFKVFYSFQTSTCLLSTLQIIHYLKQQSHGYRHTARPAKMHQKLGEGTQKESTCKQG